MAVARFLATWVLLILAFHTGVVIDRHSSFGLTLLWIVLTAVALVVRDWIVSESE